MTIKSSSIQRTALFAGLSCLFLSSPAHGQEGESSGGNEQCKLYFAPSSTSTPIEPLWGLFSGVEYDVGDIIDNYELGVNLYNIQAHNTYDPSGKDEHQAFINTIVSFLEGFMWVPEPAGAKFESDDPRVTYVPGAGILSAMNEKITNARWDHFSSYHRPMVGEIPGKAHPGRGAQTPFYNIAIKATDKIKPGNEIFLSYGSNYADSVDEEDLGKDDYEKLDETIVRMIMFFQYHKEELDEKAKMQIYSFLTRDVMNAAVGPQKQKHVGRILPPHPDQLNDILEAGGSMKYDRRAAFRHISWLQKNGFCADNIRYGASTIPEAGRGAFATRPLSVGTTIAASPMLAIPDSSILEMHRLVKNAKNEYQAESNAVTDFQMLLNYCFGHPESSMLLLPAGTGVAFINHHKEPNAKLVWSSHPSCRTDWFNLPPSDLIEEEQAYLGLVMEVVALRDIKPGEEIFLDYGEEWVVAWENHVKEWETKTKGLTWDAKAIEFNDKYSKEPFPTETENIHPFSTNVTLVAFVMIKESTAGGTLEDPKEWDVPETGTVYDSDNLFEVTIVDRMEVGGGGGQSYNYTLRWLNVKNEATHVAHVPHDAFVLVDLPGTSDHFTPMAFRHPIGIPDDVFPKGPWRNIDESEEA